MRYTTFGRRTGLRVSEYALGAGNFGTGWGVGADLDASRAVFDRFAEAGGTLIDTADGYQNGESEKFLSEFLKADRDNFVVATKYTNSPPPYTLSTTGNSRKNMVRAVEDSLRRLDTDRIDLYWVHHPDSVTPLEEILRGLDDLVSAGKILHAGLSNFPAWRIAWASATADARGWAPLIGVQVEYSLVERTADRELLPMARALGLGVALWSPLGGGLLTGKYRTSDKGRLTDWQRLVHTEDTDQKTAVVDAVLKVAEETGARASQVAMAWLRENAGPADTHIPIIGPRNLAQLEDYLTALDVHLTPEQRARIDQVSAVELGVPHGVPGILPPEVVGGDADNYLPRAVPVI
ncbi:aldo/keto reductase [Pseudonocardia spinosispora]|uniref:aldo/keto reductase n=1 Tax=Pseudonocardia spinosispora TaxID=103441 RepID=UPI0004005297|nr:aldo/keto reductase [Pseudonocardia spinosispora]